MYLCYLLDLTSMYRSCVSGCGAWRREFMANLPTTACVWHWVLSVMSVMLLRFVYWLCFRVPESNSATHALILITYQCERVVASLSGLLDSCMGAGIGLGLLAHNLVTGKGSCASIHFFVTRIFFLLLGFPLSFLVLRSRECKCPPI